MKRWLIVLASLAVAIPAFAGWQSRDSNYNQNIVASGAATCASVLPNLLINLDASNSASVIRSGANVSAWNGSSGTGVNFTCTNSPQYSASSWTGSRPSITFANGSSQSCSVSTTLSTTTASVFVVNSTGPSIQFGGLVSILGNAAGNDFGATQSVSLNTNSSNNASLVTRNSVDFAISNLAPNTDNTAGITFDGTNGRGYLDFSLTAGPTGSTGTLGNGTTSIAIGARQTPALGTYLNGKIAEVIITTGAVTGSDLTTLHSCLTTKWGVP